MYTNIAKEKMRIWATTFNCLSLLILFYSKESISINDKEAIDDEVSTVKGNLAKIDGFTASDSTHYALDHLFDHSILDNFGAPKHYGCSHFERGLNQLQM